MSYNVLLEALFTHRSKSDLSCGYAVQLERTPSRLLEA